MARMLTFIIVTTSIMVMLTLAGFQNSLGVFLGALSFGNIGEFAAGELVTRILIAIGTLGVIATAGSVVSALAPGFSSNFPNSFPASSILATVVFVEMLYDLISINTRIQSLCGIDTSCNWVTYVVGTFVVLLVVGYSVTLYDWVRGND